MTVGRQQPESFDSQSRHEGHPISSNKPETAHVHLVQPGSLNVRFWLKTDLVSRTTNVRVAPNIGHRRKHSPRPVMTQAV